MSSKATEFYVFFNLKRVKWITIGLGLITLISMVVVLLDLIEQYGSLEGVRILYIREWVFFQEEFIISIPYHISFWIAMIAGALFLYTTIMIKRISKTRETGKEMRDLLSTSASLLGIGTFLEGVYLTLRSDFRSVYEVIFQFYITLDTIATVIFIAIVYSIFIMEKFETESKMGKFVIVFYFLLIIVGFLMMILYGINPDGFAIGIVVAIGLVGIQVLLTIGLVIKILLVKRKIQGHSEALTAITVQLILLSLAGIFLIVCGLTVNTNVPVNRFFRLIRILTLMIVAIMYFPAFIRPALQKRQESKTEE
jgi:hypothetical protein